MYAIRSYYDADGGLPCVSFTPKENFIIYRIMRKDIKYGMVDTIGEYAGATTMMSVNDFTAEYGHAYEYYIVPVHPEIKIEGERLCGPPSSSA